MSERAARVEAALREAQEFLDVTVRSWLPSEHAVCVSRCVHGYWERMKADDLERVVVAIGAALAPPDGARGTK